MRGTNADERDCSADGASPHVREVLWHTRRGFDDEPIPLAALILKRMGSLESKIGSKKHNNNLVLSGAHQHHPQDPHFLQRGLQQNRSETVLSKIQGSTLQSLKILTTRPTPSCPPLRPSAVSRAHTRSNAHCLRCMQVQMHIVPRSPLQGLPPPSS